MRYWLMILFLAVCQFSCTPQKSSSVTPLIEKLNDGDCVAKIRALRELQLRADAEPAIPTLIRILEDDDAAIPGASEAVRQGLIARPEDASRTIKALAAHTLGAIGSEAKPAIPILIAKLKERDSNVRSASARALGRIGLMEEGILVALTNALGDSEWTVRIRAAEALAALDSDNQEAASTLIKLIKDKSPGIRSFASLSLGEIKTTRFIPVLVEALGDSDEGVRSSAAQSLGVIGKEAETVVPALVARLKDKSPTVRVFAAQALRHFGPAARAAIPALTRALKDTDEDVRLFARQALERISGRGDDVVEPRW